MRLRQTNDFFRDSGLDGIENGMRLAKIGNRLSCNTDAELMTVCGGTWRSDFEFSLLDWECEAPVRLLETNDFFRDFGLDGIENGMQLAQIGNRLTCNTDAGLMTVCGGTWRPDF